MCTIAAHAGRPLNARQDSSGGAGPRAVAYAADGRAEARQRDPHSQGAPEAGSEGRKSPDPRPAAGSSRIPTDREGLRPAPGGPEVRARQGEQDPDPLPDLAQQDDRRALRTAAQRARRLPAPVGAKNGAPGAKISPWLRDRATS